MDGVRFKKLEWRQIDHWNWFANSAGYQCSVELLDDGQYFPRVVGAYSEAMLRCFPTLVEAEEEAEAHFESQVRQCLEVDDE